MQRMYIYVRNSRQIPPTLCFSFITKNGEHKKVDKHGKCSTYICEKNTDISIIKTLCDGIFKTDNVFWRY
jgi:hypothetical protein